MYITNIPNSYQPYSGVTRTLLAATTSDDHHRDSTQPLDRQYDFTNMTLKEQSKAANVLYQKGF